MENKTETPGQPPTENVSFARYRLVDGKRMRRGYTTGSCAAAAAFAAAEYALTGTAEQFVRLTLPGGETLTLEVHRAEGTFEFAGAGTDTVFFVTKDSGDDPDVTNGIRIYASVSRLSGTLNDEEAERRKYFTDQKFPGLYLCGGEGVGTVTKSGLEMPAGYAAINRVPRRMIFEAVDRVRCAFINENGPECSHAGLLKRRGAGGGYFEFAQESKTAGPETGLSGRNVSESNTEAVPCLLIRIGAQNGREAAMKTFNPLLGIEGGISILGTTGIVEPMSEKALVDTIRVQLRQQISLGVRDLLLVPGHYGETYARESLGIAQTAVTISNYVGEAVDIAVDAGAESILLVGDVGKLSKIAAGIMNTHSHTADGRREIFTSHAALAGADRGTLSEIWKAVTTEEMLMILDRAGFREKVCRSVMKEIGVHLQRRAGNMPAEAVMFSKKFGIIGKTEGADALIERIRNSKLQ